MDNIDKRLLNLIQKGLPIETKPFLTFAKELEISEEEVINRLDRLKKEGYIRRLGGVFDLKKIGYFSTLCAINVPENVIDEVAKIINSYEEITHNYIRQACYNMWFTVTAYSRNRVDEIISEIKFKTGIKELISLPSIKLFKIKATFNMKEDVGC